MNTDIGDCGLFLDALPETADFFDGLAGRVTGKHPWIAARHEQLALAHDGRDFARDRDTVDFALLGGRRRF